MKLFAACTLLALTFTFPSYIAAAQSNHTPSHGSVQTSDGDHHFLRDLADHNEAMVYLAHSAMQMKHAHRRGEDAAGSMDVREDARKRQIAVALKKLFRDEKAPAVPALLRSRVDSILQLDNEAFEKAVRNFTIEHHRAAMEMIDHAAPRNKEVRALAKRIRAEYDKEIETARSAGTN